MMHRTCYEIRGDHVTNSSIATSIFGAHNSTCQLTGAIMSTRSRASCLLEAACFILLASSASWLGGTQGRLCHAHGLPSQPCGVIHCLLVQILHIPFKIVSLAKPDSQYKNAFHLLAFLATNHLTCGSYPRYRKYLSGIIIIPS